MEKGAVGAVKVEVLRPKALRFLLRLRLLGGLLLSQRRVKRQNGGSGVKLVDYLYELPGTAHILKQIRTVRWARPGGREGSHLVGSQAPVPGGRCT